METWIKRDTRKQFKSHRGTIIVLVLLIIAVSLCLYEYYDNIESLLVRYGMISTGEKVISESEIASLIRKTLNDHRLFDIEIEKALFDYHNIKTNHPCFKTIWPEEFPFIWFNTVLKQNSAGFDNLAITSGELDNADRLLVYLIHSQSADTLGEILLKSSRQAQPEMSSIAFLFDNFADYKIENALELIWMDIPFGFILKPDQIPGDKISKALSNSRGQCILEIPADRDSWELILKAHRMAKNIDDIEFSASNLRAVFGVFPTLDGIYFFSDSNAVADRDLIKLVMEQIEYYRLAYIKLGSSPVYADSLAYIKGLKIRDFNTVIDFTGLEEAELINGLIKNASDFSKSNKGIYLIRSNEESSKAIKQVQELFERLNIVQSRPLRIALSIENL